MNKKQELLEEIKLRRLVKKAIKLKLIKEKVKNKIQHYVDNHKWEVIAVGVIIIIAIII